MNRTLPILFAAVLLTSCPHNGLRPGAPIDLTRITPGAPARVYYSGLRDAGRTAVFDAATFETVWQHAFKGLDPAPPVPAVDFSREFVIVAALGERSSGGYAIDVTGAALQGNVVVADVLTTSPGKTCVVTRALSQPLDIVKLPLPASGRPEVSFLEQSVVRDCGP